MADVIDYPHPGPVSKIEERQDNLIMDMLRILEGYGVPPNLAPQCASAICRIVTEFFAAINNDSSGGACSSPAWQPSETTKETQPIE